MKKNTIGKISQGAMLLVLFILIFFMIHYVNDIQGTARVVNYAGLVRGETQRMVKLEIAEHESEDIVKKLDTFVDGIQNGSKELNLVKIDEEEFQEKVEELSASWETLKHEVENVRKTGYLNTNIILMSEDYFKLSDEVVELSEQYSQRCATNIRNLEIMIVVLILILLFIMLKQSIAALKVIAINRELKQQVFWDNQTNLPNKNRCARLLEDESLIRQPTVFFMFDLNNLKYVNDNMGHEQGDILISNFAKLIREGIPESYFVGRYGGDEFIAILTGEDQPQAEVIKQAVQKKADAFNESGEDLLISYAVGYASSKDFEECTLKMLLEEADKNMYENKKITKKCAEDVERKLEHSLVKMLEALGSEYSECCYCNANTGTFRIFQQKEESKMPKTGILKEQLELFISLFVQAENKQRIREMLSVEYIREHLTRENRSYHVTCCLENTELRGWWKVTVMYVDSDENGKLDHFLLLFKEISDEMELKFEAKHDGLTNLWNKTSAFSMMEAELRKGKKEKYCIIVIDIDDFKQVNDTMGHSVGDDVIREVAGIIQSQFRSEDVVARFGGDEFFIFAAGSFPKERMEEKANNIRNEVEKHFQGKYDELEITISIGIAISEKQTSTEQLFHEADKALYQAKKSGKNQYAIYE